MVWGDGLWFATGKEKALADRGCFQESQKVKLEDLAILIIRAFTLPSPEECEKNGYFKDLYVPPEKMAFIRKPKSD